jgi:lysophospholipase L1-like esterase
MKVACVGDSITYFSGTINKNSAKFSYPYCLDELLNESYPGEFEVRRYGLVEGSIKSFLNSEPHIASLKFLPSLVIILLGMNDFNTKDEDFFTNYKTLVSSYGQINFILCSPPPLFKNGVLIENDLIQNRIIKLALETDSVFVDLYKLEVFQDPKMSFEEDKICSNGLGMIAISNIVYETIEKCLS